MSIVRTALTCAALAAAAGFACGVLYSFGGFFHDLFTTGLNAGTAMAFGALVGMPVVFAGFGLLGGLVLALLWRGWVSVVGSRKP